MENTTENVAISLLGKELLIKCEADKAQALQAAAALLNQEMIAAREKAKLLTHEHAAVLAALNISDELLQLKKQQHQQIDLMDNRIDDLKTKIEDVLL